MLPELVDTHCHLALDPLAGMVDDVLKRAHAAGVQRCVTIGTDLVSSEANVTLAHRYPQFYAAVGVHPHDASTVTEEVLQAIDALADDPRVVAIGEIGLDFFRPGAPAEVQVRALRGFFEIARRRQLPVLIHCRNAYELMIHVLREDGQGLSGLMHCASGPPAFIEEALAHGFFISFAGNVTFPNAHAVRALVPLVPDDRLLIETDAPFLAPQPVRGQPNEPAYVVHTATVLAQLRGTTIEALGESTSRNARTLFHFSA